MITPELSILNQKGTPMFNSDVLASRPPFGIVGRIFISTDTKELYRDTGTAWELLAGPGSGTITGSGTAGTLPIFTGSSSIGDSSLLEGSTKFTTTKSFQAQSIFLNDMTAGSGALYYNVAANRLTLANYNVGGNVYIEVGGGSYAQIISGADNSTTFYGNIIRNGGLSTQFLKADGSLDSTTYQPLLTNPVTGTGTTTQVAFWSGSSAISSDSALYWDNTNKRLGIGTSTPGVALDVHGSNVIQQLNGTGTTNARLAFQNAGTNKWVIGNIHSGGDNYLQIFDTASSLERVKLENTGTLTLSGSQKIDGANALSGGFLGFKQFASTTSSEVGYTGISALSTDILSLAFYQSGSGGGTIYRTIRFSAASIANSATRTFTFPNASGTLALTADLSAYLLLTGGTLTGALNGTSATFSSSVTANGINTIINGNGDNLNFKFSSGYGNTSLGVTFDSGADANNFLRFKVNNAAGSAIERMVINGVGNIGIGVTPSAWVGSFKAIELGATGNSIAGASSGTILTTNAYYDSGIGGFRYARNAASTFVDLAGGMFAVNIAPSGTAGNTISFTQAMTLNASGNLLVGRTSAFGSERVSIESASTNPIVTTYNFSASAITHYEIRNQNGIVGSIVASGGSTTYNTSSDYRLKTDLKDFAGVDIVNLLKVYDYQWKSDNSRSYGVLAHELQSVIPYAVTGVKDGEQMQGVDYSKLVPVLIKAIQELKSQIDSK